MRILKSFINKEKIRQITTFPGFLVILILLGIIFRFVTIFTDIPKYDGTFYATIGYNIATQHEFVTLGGTPTYAFSLTYPPYLALFYSVLGFSIPVTQLASIIVSVAVLIIAYITTANLMGKEKALIVTAFLALLPSLILSAGKNHIDGIVLIFFIPTMWAILKSFKNSHYIIFASFFAGLVYYTKTDIGFPIVLGGIVIYAMWRFYHMRWDILKDKNYYIAFIILLIMVLLRAYLVQTSGAEISTVTGKGLRYFSSFEGIFKILIQFLFHVLLIGSFLIFWALEFKRSIFDFKKENAILPLSALALIIPIIIHSSSYPLFSTEPIEKVSRAYITIVYVPFLWAFLSNKNLDKISSKTKGLIASTSNLLAGVFKDRKKLLFLITGLFLAGLSVLVDDYLPILYFFGSFALIIVPLRKRVLLLLVAFLILSVNSLTFQYIPAYVDIVDDEINHRIEEGDEIALVIVEGGKRLTPDIIYPYISVRDVSLEVYHHSNITEARFIISELNETFEGYEFIGTYRGNVRPSVLKSIAMTFLGGSERYKQPPLYLWERV